MRHRVEVGTDIALIGAWDESQGDNILPTMPYKQYQAALETDAQEGNVFLLQLGGDWGGSVDVFADTDVPRSYKSRLQAIKGKFLLSVPTGRLVVGGAEDYRSEAKSITSETSVIHIPPGDYQLRCYFAKEDDEAISSQVPSDAEVAKAIGADDYSYYQRMNKRSVRGFWLLLLFPALAFPIGWKWALLATIIIVLAYFHVQEWFQRRDAKYQRIEGAVNEFIAEAQGRAMPMFAFELRRIGDGHGIRGGIVDFAKVANGKGRRSDGQAIAAEDT